MFRTMLILCLTVLTTLRSRAQSSCVAELCPNQILKNYPTYSFPNYPRVFNISQATFEQSLTNVVSAYFEDTTGVRFYAQCGQYVYVNQQRPFINSPPRVMWNATSKATQIYSAYTVMMFDPDITDPTNVKYPAFLHWLVYDIPTNYLLAKNSQGTNVFSGRVKSQYFIPGPPAGKHRYTFAIYGQRASPQWKNSTFIPTPFGHGSFVIPGSIAKDYPLDLIGVNYFLGNMTSPDDGVDCPASRKRGKRLLMLLLVLGGALLIVSGCLLYMCCKRSTERQHGGSMQYERV